jgi:hypothetical protein
MPATMSRAYSFDGDVVAEDTNICQLQELGISPAYAESFLRTTGSDVNEAAALAFSDWTAGVAAAAGDDCLPLVTLILNLLTSLPPPRQVMNRAVAAGAVAVGTSHCCRHLRNFCDSGITLFLVEREKRDLSSCKGIANCQHCSWAAFF